MTPIPKPPPQPVPRPKAKVKVRDLDRGVPVSENYHHTSFRLYPSHKRKLREIAKRKYGGITMSAVLRLWIDRAAQKEGIE